MGGRFIKAIEWLLMDFEARMVTFMIWLCWVCGITSDEVARVREAQNAKVERASKTNNSKLTPEPRQPPSTSRHPSHGA